MSDSIVLVDVNIPMYAAGQTHPYKAACVWIITQTAEGELVAAIDAEIIIAGRAASRRPARGDFAQAVTAAGFWDRLLVQLGQLWQCPARFGTEIRQLRRIFSHQLQNLLQAAL